MLIIFSRLILYCAYQQLHRERSIFFLTSSSEHLSEKIKSKDSSPLMFPLPNAPKGVRSGSFPAVLGSPQK